MLVLVWLLLVVVLPLAGALLLLLFPPPPPSPPPLSLPLPLLFLLLKSAGTYEKEDIVIGRERVKLAQLLLGAGGQRQKQGQLQGKEKGQGKGKEQLEEQWEEAGIQAEEGRRILAPLVPLTDPDLQEAKSILFLKHPSTSGSGRQTGTGRTGLNCYVLFYFLFVYLETNNVIVLFVQIQVVNQLIIDLI
jgi:hypothetical protein